MDNLKDRISYIKTDLLQYYEDASDNENFPGCILDYVSEMLNLINDIEEFIDNIEKQNNE